MACRTILPCLALMFAGSALTGCTDGAGSPRAGTAGATGSEGGAEADTDISTSITAGATANPADDDGGESTGAASTGAVQTSDDATTDGGSTDDDGGSSDDSEDTTGDDSSSTDDGSTSEAMVVGVDDLVEGDLVITEVMYNPAFCTDATCEWIEIYNASGSPVDLLGLLISDIGASSGEIEDSAVLAPGEYGVLGASDSDDWGYTFEPLAHYGSSGPFFSQADGDLVEIANNATTIDIILYTANGDRNAGASLELDPAALDADLNDDEAQWCVAQDDFGDGDLGSPGSANAPCP